MRGLKILSGGFLTTVQDRGRLGYQQYGMPVAGALDEFAHRVGNLLVGNYQYAAALEITVAGPSLSFAGDALIAVTGANLGPLLDGLPLPMWQSVPVGNGSVLSFSGRVAGCRAYLCTAGSFALPPLMGSLSTYLRGCLGGFAGRKLQAGDFIPLGPPPSWSPLRAFPPELVPAYPDSQTLRVVLGPQEDYFTLQGIDTFLTAEYTVSLDADRMGCRLEGPLIEHSWGADIISDGLPAGAVQVPGHGLPIVMLADRPTTGGYPKIATLITADIPKIAQLLPGGKVRFTAVSMDEAHRILREFEQVIQLGISETY